MNLLCLVVKDTRIHMSRRARYGLIGHGIGTHVMMLHSTVQYGTS